VHSLPGLVIVSTALAGNLLAPGLQQFSYNLGFPSGTFLGQRQYDWSQPQLALTYRWGDTNTLTLGGHLQATPSSQMVNAFGPAVILDLQSYSCLV
jgi:outer membrane usher protein